MEDFFIEFGALFSVFEWWTLLFIAATVALMCPLNMLYKKIMKSDDVVRLRKLIAFFSVYVVACAIVCIFTAIVSPESFSSKYVMSSTIALGFCAQVMWEFVKVIRDYGWKKFANWIAYKTDWSKALKEFCKKYDLNENTVGAIVEEIESKYIDKECASEIDAIINNETSIVSELKDRLKGSAEEGNIEQLAIAVYEFIRDSLNDAEDVSQNASEGIPNSDEILSTEEIVESVKVTENTPPKTSNGYIEIK